MSLESMISTFDALFDPAHALSVAALEEHMQHPGDERARLVSKASDDLYDAITTGLAALRRINELKEVKPA